MAIYHCSIKTFSRAKGQSSTAAAAYRAGLKMTDERTGEISDYTKKRGIVSSQVITPKNAPAWASDPSKLWNAAEAAESRKNSTVAREFEISLPHELSPDQRQQLAQEIAQALVDRFGFAVQFSIHKPGNDDNNKNHHVHILATTRNLEADGFTSKTRELDEVAKEKDELTGRRYNPAMFEVREMVADKINSHLGRAGIKETVSHKSLENQKIDALESGDLAKAILLERAPQVHIGKNPFFSGANLEKNNQILFENRQRFEASIKEMEPVIDRKQMLKTGIAKLKNVHTLKAEGRASQGVLMSNQSMPVVQGGAVFGGGADVVGFDESITGMEQAIANLNGQIQQARLAGLSVFYMILQLGELKTKLKVLHAQRAGHKSNAGKIKAGRGAQQPQQQQEEQQSNASQLMEQAQKLRRAAEQAAPRDRAEINDRAWQLECKADELQAKEHKSDHEHRSKSGFGI